MMFIFLILLFAALAIVFQSVKLGISPLPSHWKVKRYLTPFLPPKNALILDLGSGWGGIASYMAKAMPESSVIGFEKSLFPWLFSLLRKRKNLHFYRRNFFHEKLEEADCIYVYLFPKAMEKLKIKLEKELKNKTIVISYVFAVPGWKPIQTYEIADLYKSKLYVYQHAEGP